MATIPLGSFSQHLASDHLEHSHLRRLKRLYGGCHRFLRHTQTPIVTASYTPPVPASSALPTVHESAHLWLRISKLQQSESKLGYCD